MAAPTRDHALGMRGRVSGAHQLDQQLGRKSVREHQRLGATGNVDFLSSSAGQSGPGEPRLGRRIRHDIPESQRDVT